DHRAPRRSDQHQAPWLLLVAIDAPHDPEPERGSGHARQRTDRRHARPRRLGEEEEVADEQPEHRREPEQDAGANEVAPAGDRVAVERARLVLRGRRERAPASLRRCPATHAGSLASLKPGTLGTLMDLPALPKRAHVRAGLIALVLLVEGVEALPKSPLNED